MQHLVLHNSDMNIFIEMPVVFADDLPFNVLLGQKYFFAATDVRFEKRNNKFFLKKIGKTV